MKMKNYIPLCVCLLMTIFSVIVGILYPPTLNFYVLYAALWGIFTGIGIGINIYGSNNKTKL